MAALSGPFDQVSRSILGSLAKALIPLEDWIRARKPPPYGDDYEPPNAHDLPWRQDGQSLSIDRLGAIEFLEALVRESNGDALLLKSWEEIQADPLKRCPTKDTNAWRAARGLATPSFAVVQSQNVLLDDRGNQIARGEFYGSYMPHLIIAAARRQPKGDADWRKFALDLFSDSCKEWPIPPETARSSRFMLQFLRDLMYAILGVRNPAPEPWRTAVLTEIGEFRRPGNVYSRKDVERGVNDFKKVIDSYRPRKGPLVTTEAVVEEQVAVSGFEGKTAGEEEVSDAVKAHYLAWNSRGSV